MMFVGESGKDHRAASAARPADHSRRKNAPYRRRRVRPTRRLRDSTGAAGRGRVAVRLGSRPSRAARPRTAISCSQDRFGAFNLAAISLRLGGSDCSGIPPPQGHECGRGEPAPDTGIPSGLGTVKGAMLMAAMSSSWSGRRSVPAWPGSCSRVRPSRERIRWACRLAARSIPCGRCSGPFPHSSGRSPGSA